MGKPLFNIRCTSTTGTIWIGCSRLSEKYRTSSRSCGGPCDYSSARARTRSGPWRCRTRGRSSLLRRLLRNLGALSDGVEGFPGVLTGGNSKAAFLLPRELSDAYLELKLLHEARLYDRLVGRLKLRERGLRAWGRSWRTRFGTTSALARAARALGFPFFIKDLGADGSRPRRASSLARSQPMRTLQRRAGSASGEYRPNIKLHVGNEHLAEEVASANHDSKFQGSGRRNLHGRALV